MQLALKLFKKKKKNQPWGFSSLGQLAAWQWAWRGMCRLRRLLFCSPWLSTLRAKLNISTPNSSLCGWHIKGWMIYGRIHTTFLFGRCHVSPWTPKEDFGFYCYLFLCLFIISTMKMRYDYGSNNIEKRNKPEKLAYALLWDSSRLQIRRLRLLLDSSALASKTFHTSIFLVQRT